MHLTLVIGYRNRELGRVFNCLESLKQQRISEFKVVFVDYGSTKKYSQEAYKLVSKYPFARYIYCESKGMPWNRAHALNCGIKMSDTKFTMTTDIDLIFSPEFIQGVLDHLDPKIELHSSAYSLPKRFKNFIKLHQRRPHFKRRPSSSLGLSQSLATDVLCELRGFDETFNIYGIEDIDLRERAAENGIELQWLDLNKYPVFHQWHPPFILNSQKEIPGGWINYKSRYQEITKTSIRNNKNWGRLLTLEDRPTLELLNAKQPGDYTYTIVPTSVFHNLLEIVSQLEEMQSGESIIIKYLDEQKRNFERSTVYQLIKFVNKINYRLNIPFKLTTDQDYSGNYISTTHIRDMMLYLIDSIGPYDFYLAHNHETFECFIVK